MAIMATIKQRPGGTWEYRRRVPDKLRPLLKLTEVRRSLDTKDKGEAKLRVVAVIAEVDRLFAAAGQVVTLDHKRIAALAAEWLSSRVTRDEASPPDVDTIDVQIDAIQDASEDRRSILRMMSSAVDDLLLSKSLPHVDEASREDLSIALFWSDLTYWQTMARRRRNDYGAVPGLADAPRWVPPVGADGSPSDTASVTLSSLFDAWAVERKPSQKTVDSWRSCLLKFAVFVGHDDAARVTDEDVVRWKDSLVASGLSAATVNDKHLASLRAALEYGKRNRKLPANVARGVSALVARGSKVKAKGYTDDEARTILTAARQLTGWRRWLPFVCAYTGARVSEPADAAAADVKVSPEGIAYLDMTSRLLKNDSSARAIPLHPALIAEGFLDYVKALPSGSALFPDCPPAKTYGRRGDTASKVVSAWVRRDLGFTDKSKAPNHAWRHRMATLHRAAKIPRDASRYLRGYVPEDDADDYGTHNLATLAEYMARIPPMA